VKFRLSDYSTVKSGRCPVTLKMEAASPSETLVVVTYKRPYSAALPAEQSATSGSLCASSVFR
jgi:hypothetical protein